MKEEQLDLEKYIKDLEDLLDKPLIEIQLERDKFLEYKNGKFVSRKQP